MSSFKLENELTKNKIPFEKRGGMKFIEYQCVDEIISFLSIIANTANKFEWFNVLKLIPGIGNKAATTISDSMHEMHFLDKFKTRKYYNDLVELLDNLEDWKTLDNPTELFDEILPYYYAIREYTIDISKTMSSSNKFDAKDRLKRDMKVLEVFKDMAADYDSIKEFLEDIALDTVKTKDDYSEDRLVITTIHSAKGLEWKAVILLDCTDYEIDDYEEELRCWYVAMTRAEDELILSVPRSAIIQGQLTRVNLNPIIQPSRKFFDISY